MTKQFKILIYLLPIPFLANFLINIKNLKHLEVTNFVFAFFCFLFLYFLGIQISEVFKFNSISLSIAIYLVSIFSLNFLFLPFDKYFFTFKQIFLILNLMLLLFVLIKKGNVKKLGFLLIYLVLLRYSSNYIDFSNINYVQYSSDVSKFWNPMTEKIYNKDLYFALRLNIFEGYSLMINYVFAELSYLFIEKKYFSFAQVIPNIFLFLNLLVIKELKIERLLKISLIIIYISIVLNSDWISYLFMNSLMGEVIVNFIFTVFVVNFYNNPEIQYKKSYFFLLGFLYFLKPFASILFLVIALSMYKNQKKLYYIYLPIFGFLFNYIYSNTLLTDKLESERDIVENIYIKILLENGEKFFDFKLSNILTIFTEFILIDKVLTLFLVLYLITKTFGVRSGDNFNILTQIIILNLLLVLYLYTTVWKSMEFGSSYRYIFSFLSLYFIDMFLTLDKFLNKKSRNVN